jgi:hypothetical protein
VFREDPDPLPFSGQALIHLRVQGRLAKKTNQKDQGCIKILTQIESLPG